MAAKLIRFYCERCNADTSLANPVRAIPRELWRPRGPTDPITAWICARCDRELREDRKAKNP